MADRRIDQLTEAEDISDEDLFVIWKENIFQTRSIKKGTMNLATKDYVDSKVPDFSTEEKDIGVKWIDNKPIYRKTFQIGNIVISKEITIPNIDKVISINSIRSYDSSQQNIYVFGDGVTPANYMIFSYTNNGIILRPTGTSTTLYNVIATIEYTKTTD